MESVSSARSLGDEQVQQLERKLSDTSQDITGVDDETGDGADLICHSVTANQHRREHLLVSSTKAADEAELAVHPAAVDQSPIEFDVVLVDTAKDTKEGPAFHPAAAVFVSEALAGVGDENKMLEERNSRLRYLHDFIQKLVICFSSPSSQTIQRQTTIVYEKTMSVETLLSNGSVVIVDDEERLVIPITAAAAHPVDDCGTIGNISVALAGMPLGSFVMGRFSCNDPVQIKVNDNGSVHLRVHLSQQLYVEGILDAPMSDEELIAFVEREDVRSNMQVDIPIVNTIRGTDYSLNNESGITFRPKSISMSLSPRLRKIFSLVTEAPVSATRDCKEDAVDDLRRLVVEALGEREHKELLLKNIELKTEITAISEIRNLLLGIEVSHSAGVLRISLDEGQIAANADWWSIAVNGKDNVSVPVADIGRINLTFSGTYLPLNFLETLANVGQTMVISFRHMGWSHIRFLLFGSFNWDDFEDDEIPEIAEHFRMKMSRVLQGYGDSVFPATMEFKIQGILCDLPLAKANLMVAGLWEEPAPDKEEFEPV